MHKIWIFPNGEDTRSMDMTQIFVFDEIVEIDTKTFPKNYRELFFRSLPDVHFAHEVPNTLKKNRQKGIRNVLVAYNSETLVKESLLALDACRLFDDLIIAEEQFPFTVFPKTDIEQLLTKRYGAWNYFTSQNRICH